MMFSERDERMEQLRRQRREREALRRQQARQRRALMLRLGMAGVALVLAAVVIVLVSKGKPADPADPSGSGASQTQAREPEAKPTKETKPRDSDLQTPTTIHIVAAGDLNVTDEIVLDAMGISGYDFSPALVDVAPVLAAGDLTILNFEGTLAGAPYGTQRGSAPQALAQALADIGVDVVQTANSAAIRAGVLGLQSTISGFQNAGIATVGTFADSRDFRAQGGFTLVEVEGIRIALVAFTKGMDNLGLPEGSEDCVNLLYKDYTSDYKTVDSDGIRKVLDNVREEQLDLTIALVHWGSEYNEEISKSQKTIRNLMLEEGVDVILGSHPHLLHEMEYDSIENTFVAWSLGDFFGNAPEPGSNYSAILDLEVTRDNLTGDVAISGYSVVPIYTLTPEDSGRGGHRVVRLEEAIARYENNYIGRVTEPVYNSMTYALKRVGQRIAGE